MLHVRVYKKINKEILTWKVSNTVFSNTMSMWTITDKQFTHLSLSRWDAGSDGSPEKVWGNVYIYIYIYIIYVLLLLK